jgi:hypothetical protein
MSEAWQWGHLSLEDEVAARFDLTVPEDRAEVLRRLEALLAR